MTYDSSRRTFVKQLAAGAVVTPVLGGLLSVREAFGQQLDKMALERRTASSFPAFRDDYMLAPNVRYLNHASIGTIPRVVHDTRLEYLRLCETNPWLYMWGGAWEEAREEARHKIAGVLHCETREVSITHNTTEAFNILANGLPLGPSDEVVFSSLNHTGASAAFFHRARDRGFTVNRFQFPVLDIPEMSADDVLAVYDANISSNTKLLVFPHIDNIVGLRHPVRELARLARSRGVEFVAVDAAQTVGMIPVDARNMGVDLYSTSPHKWLQAPKGLGVTYVGSFLQEVMRPMWVTWGQSRWQGTARIFEDYGTRNLAEALTLGDAIDFQERLSSEERTARLRTLWQYTRAKTETTPGASWASPAEWELGGSLYTVSFARREANDLSRRLFQEHGIVVRPFNEQGVNGLRLSPNVFNTEDEIDELFGAV